MITHYLNVLEPVALNNVFSGVVALCIYALGGVLMGWLWRNLQHLQRNERFELQFRLYLLMHGIIN